MLGKVKGEKEKQEGEQLRVEDMAFFIHIPKTGGASMGTAPFILQQGSPMTPPTNDFIMSTKLRFSFVREPYDRVASVILNLEWATPETFTDFIKNDLIKIHASGFLAGTKAGEARLQQLWTMYKYLYFENKLEVDFLGRFENIEEDWKEVCKRVGVEHPLPHLNKQKKFSNYDKYYTPETREIITRLYSKDFDTFGYKRKGGETS